MSSQKIPRQPSPKEGRQASPVLTTRARRAGGFPGATARGHTSGHERLVPVAPVASQEQPRAGTSADMNYFGFFFLMLVAVFYLTQAA